MRLSFSTVIWFCVVVAILLPLGLVLGLSQWAPRTPSRGDWTVNLYRQGEGLVALPLEEYVKGVVAAEVPALFETEALKAQAVAARTYVVKKLRATGGEGCDLHPNADVCTDPRHGQAFATPSELFRRWGVFNYLRFRSKISAAVEATAGEVLTYGGEYIDAVYHSTSADLTENSEDVWGRYVPYLRSVRCEWDRESPRYLQTRRIAVTSLERALSVKLLRTGAPQGGGRGVPLLAGRQVLPGSITINTLTSTGRVREATVGGRVFTGRELREKLGLASTYISFRLDGDNVEVTTKGYGHGVGLCQYGANGLAKAGRFYRDILTHYFTGVRLERLASPPVQP